MRYLGILILMAVLLSACDLTRASAPPLVVSVQATPQPHDPPQESEPKREYIPPGLKVGAGVPALVTERFYRLAYMYPDVAKRTQRIEARRGVKGWQVSYESPVIYVNTWYGEYILADKLTQEFAKRAFAQLQRSAPGTAKTFRTWKRFAAWLATGVK